MCSDVTEKKSSKSTFELPKDKKQANPLYRINPSALDQSECDFRKPKMERSDWSRADVFIVFF